MAGSSLHTEGGASVSSASFAPPELADLRNEALAARLQHAIDHKTKPLGSLGRIESLALQIGLILRSERPTLASPQVVVFAGDHGLAARGVSAFPPDVTWQMVEDFLAGRAAISVLARQLGLAFTVVDGPRKVERSYDFHTVQRHAITMSLVDLEGHSTGAVSLCWRRHRLARAPQVTTADFNVASFD